MWICLERFLRRSEGLSLLELSLYVVIMTVFLSMTVNIGNRWVRDASLRATTVRMVQDMRFTQYDSESVGHALLFQFSTYTPEYWIYDGSRILEHAGFAPGVSYFDGYLPLTTRRLYYNQAGGSTLGGSFRLVSQDESTRIVLYMGSGLQVVKGP